jgi:hypothetical protein
MDSFTRTELKMILSGLHREREAMRKDFLAEEPNCKLMDVEEYNRLVRLQDKIIDALESRFY